MRLPSPRVKWIVTLGALPATILLLEAGLRLGGFHQPPLSVPIVVWTSKQDQQFDAQGGLHRVDLDTLWSPRPGQLVVPGETEVINAAGYRGPLLPLDKDPGTLRVALLGESNVFGMYVPWGQTAAPRLQALVTQAGRSAEVLNAGVIGFDVCQGVERYRALVRPHHPDVVVAAFGLHNEFAGSQDLPTLDKLASAHAMRAGSRHTWYELSSEFRTLQLVNWLQARVFGDDPAAELERRREAHTDALAVVGRPDWPGRRRVSLDEFEAALRELARDVRADDARLILVDLPRREDAERNAPVLALYSERLHDVARREGCQVLDLRGAVNGGLPGALTCKDLLLDDWHFNDRGHALLAERLAPLGLDPSLGRLSAEPR